MNKTRPFSATINLNPMIDIIYFEACAAFSQAGHSFTLRCELNICPVSSLAAFLA